MKYAAAVLRNKRNSLSSVRYGVVTDAFLSGGIVFDEVVFLSYDDEEAVSSALSRLCVQCDGVFLICDKVLLSLARAALSVAAGKPFAGGYLLDTPVCLFGVLPAGERGAEIVKEEVVAAVDRRRGESFSRTVVRTMSAPSERVFSALSAAQDAAGEEVVFHMSEEDGCGRIELLYNQRAPKVTVDEATRILASELSDYVYAMEDVSIKQRLADVLRLHRLRISVAESFTGGGVCHEIVSVAGASKVFYEGLNTYDNDSKKERLGVSEYTLRTKGAVSSETAYEMAAGLLKGGHCDVALSTTGIAGPESDGTDKPVGLCFIGVGTAERIRVFRFQLEGEREAIMNRAVNLALFLAYKEING